MSAFDDRERSAFGADDDANPPDADSLKGAELPVVKYSGAREFEQFYEANKESLVMQQGSRYPINRIALAEWIADLALSGANKSARNFANIVAEHLRHVPWADFYGRLRRCATQLAERCKSEQRDILLFVPGEYNKSNTWCALIVWPLIREFVVDVVDEIDQHIVHRIRRPTMIVYCDDAAFTGSQAHEAIVKSAVSYALFSKPNVSLFYCIPFATQRAYYKLRGVGDGDRARFPPATDRIMNLYEINKKRPAEASICFDDLAKEPGFGTVHWFHSLLYFDHKLPDHVSVVNYIIAFAPCFHRAEQRFRMRPLVTGCNVADYSVDERYDNDDDDDDDDNDNDNDPDVTGILPPEQIVLLEGDSQEDFVHTHVCPPAFYKRIKWR